MAHRNGTDTMIAVSHCNYQQVFLGDESRNEATYSYVIIACSYGIVDVRQNAIISKFRQS